MSVEHQIVFAGFQLHLHSGFDLITQQHRALLPAPGRIPSQPVLLLLGGNVGAAPKGVGVI